MSNRKKASQQRKRGGTKRTARLLCLGCIRRLSLADGVILLVNKSGQ